MERFTIALSLDVEVQRLPDGGLHCWLIWPDGFRRLLLNLTLDGVMKFREYGSAWIVALEVQCGSSRRLAEALGPAIWRECGAEIPQP